MNTGHELVLAENPWKDDDLTGEEDEIIRGMYICAKHLYNAVDGMDSMHLNDMLTVIADRLYEKEQLLELHPTQLWKWTATIYYNREKMDEEHILMFEKIILFLKNIDPNYFQD